MNVLIEEHAVSYLDSTRTFHKEMDSLQNVWDRNDFKKWLCKLNVITEKLDIKLKCQKIKIIQKMTQYDYLKELRNRISHIISLWSLFCSIWVYASLHFLPILLEN